MQTLQTRHANPAPTVVGYTNHQLRDGGQIAAPNFQIVANVDHEFWVSDLKITGYEEDEGLWWNAYESANFCALTKGGGTDRSEGKYFIWSAEWDDDNTCFKPGKWVDSHSDPITAKGKGDVQLQPGEAFWLNVLEGDGEHRQYLVSAGEVIQAEIQVPLRDGGNSVANPNAVPVWVSDLTVTGYEEDEGLWWNAYESANFCALTKGGGTDRSEGKYFIWSAEWDDDNTCFKPGKWVDSHSNPITAKGKGDVQLQPGEGIWLNVLEGDGEHHQMLIIPQQVGVTEAK